MKPRPAFLAIHARRRHGSSLLEFAAAVAIVAVGLAFGLPGLRFLWHVQRTDAATAALADALRLGRAEALRRGQRVSLCPSVDGLRCAPGQPWEAGWIMFEDAAAAMAPAPDTQPLQSHPALSRVTVSPTRTLARAVSFTAEGWPRQANGALLAGSFQICSPAGGRRIVLSAAGRVRTEEFDCRDGA